MVRLTWFLIGLLFVPLATLKAGQDDYSRYEAGFKNFITCELTRTDAVAHFKGEPTITMINLHDIRQESGMKILTGAVQCDVQGRLNTLYLALGVEKIKGREKVSYYQIKKQPFHILASELIRYPYSERCPWTRYWIDLD